MTPDVAKQLIDTLAALSRGVDALRDVQRQTVTALRDVHTELEYLRTERRRMERLEAQIADLRENERANEHIGKLLDEAETEIAKSRTITDKQPALKNERTG